MVGALIRCLPRLLQSPPARKLPESPGSLPWDVDITGSVPLAARDRAENTDVRCLVAGRGAQDLLPAPTQLFQRDARVCLVGHVVLLVHCPARPRLGSFSALGERLETGEPASVRVEAPYRREPGAGTAA